jgi:23S rRNA pseudouridine1911/1915/1917 synthase
LKRPTLPEITVLHAGAHWVVVDKPSGLPSAPIASRESETAVSQLLRILSQLRPELGLELARVAQEVGRPLEAGLLHRLDNGTSGVLAFARSPEDYRRARAAWKTASVHKIYRAVVSGVGGFPETPLVLDAPIGRSAKSRKRMLVAPHGVARPPQGARGLRGSWLPALTRIVRAVPLPGQTLTAPQESHALYDLEIRIETGVMHQIRSHLASIAWPILGDPIYHGSAAPRLWLHAWKLVLPGGEAFEAPLPSGWPS